MAEQKQDATVAEVRQSLAELRVGLAKHVHRGPGGAFQPLSAILTALSALANAAGVLTNNGAGVLSWGAGGGGANNYFPGGWV
jgi:hypothetical protein